MPAVPIIAVFGASRPMPGDGRYEEAERCGRLLGESGYSVLTGGYGGTMEAVSRGARAAGARVVGVTAPTVFPGRPGANEFVTEEIGAPTLTRRIDMMIEMASATITLPGSIGTLTELMMAWNVAFVGRFSSTPPQPVVAVGDPWRNLIPRLTEDLGTDGNLVTWVETVDDAVREVAAALDR
jgi:uncharacterized protein (TIGR00730 family)